MQLDPSLAGNVVEAHWWLSQMIGQLLGEREWIIDIGDDALAPVREINAMRPFLETAGLAVPAMTDVELDPLGNMIAWRDYLATVRTVH